MQYYYLKTKVQLGDIIDFNGLKVEVTMNLIKANPELFIVEEELIPEYVECIKQVHSNEYPKVGQIIKADELGNLVGICMYKSITYNNCFKPSTLEAFQRQELLEEAKKRYPVGTRFKSVLSKEIYTVNSPSHRWLKDGIEVDGVPWVYYAGNWAEILTPLFQTEDKVDIYDGDGYAWVSTTSMSYLYNLIVNKGHARLLESEGNTFKVFSNKQAAEAWLEANKPKDLQYYEDLLLGTPDYFTRGKNIVIAKRDFYFLLKEQEPRLYYQKVLELIQQDLDNGWKPDWKNFLELKYCIHYRNMLHSTYDVESNTILNTGVIYFKSEKSAQKAIEVIGDKLNYIFK